MISINRHSIRLKADPTKVLLQPFFPGNEKRIKNIIQRVLWLSNLEAEKAVEQVISLFSNRHKNLEKMLLKNYNLIENYVEEKIIPKPKKILIGAYFSKEFSIESAALFNPSIVMHPDQSGLEKGELRFVLSLRATGEGHISSLEFREGIISSSGDIQLINESSYRVSPENRTNPELHHKVALDLFEANYDIEFSKSRSICERVIFPYTKTESNGIEDVRFVQFSNESDHKYYGTFTAYDGKQILSELIETEDFRRFRIRTFEGNGAKDKGMALFPEKINGNYMMISRQDGENIYIMESENIYVWNDPVKLKEPDKGWQFVQLGNCGSPLKTEAGWVLITHAVGPLRTYVISALLLDLHDPYKVIGVLEEPILTPNEEEREGYVPNVVYSCGSIIHNGNLIIPYAMSDSATSFASISVKNLLEQFQHD